MTVHFATPAPEAFPGVSRIGRELELLGLAKHIHVRDVYRIGEEDVAVFGAWDPTSYPLAIRRCKAKKKGAVFTSPPAQAEMSGVELQYLEHIMKLLERNIIQFVWVLDAGWLGLYKDERVLHAPAPLYVPPEFPKKEAEGRNVGLFAPSHPRKNILNQLLACKLVKPPVVLHTNVQGYDSVLSKIEAKRYGWLPQEEYERVLSKLDLGLQCSYSGVEAFDYVCADFMIRDIPCLSTVEWVPKRCRCGVRAWEIAKRMEEALNEPIAGAREHIIKLAEQNNSKVKELIEWLKK